MAHMLLFIAQRKFLLNSVGSQFDACLTNGCCALSRYLSEQRLPRRMLRLQNGPSSEDRESLSGEGGECGESAGDCMNGEPTEKLLGGLGAPPYVIGDLQIISLGNFPIACSCCFLS